MRKKDRTVINYSVKTSTRALIEDQAFEKNLFPGQIIDQWADEVAEKSEQNQNITRPSETGILSVNTKVN